MNRIKYGFYAFLLAFLFCNPACAQNDKKVIKIGKMIQESHFSSWEQDTFLTYYIAAEAKKTERFIKKGNWNEAIDKRYQPYNMLSMRLIRQCLDKSLSTVLTDEQKKVLNPIGDRSNIFWSDFYVFVKSKQRFVKIGMMSSTAKYLTQEQIYEILRLYSKCKLPVHPVAGGLKEKDYYVTGASTDRIK